MSGFLIRSARLKCDIFNCIQVIHGDYICRESELSKYTDLLLTPNMGERNTVVAIRLHKATYKEPYGDLLPIIALDYDSKTTEQVRLNNEPGSPASHLTH